MNVSLSIVVPCYNEALNIPYITDKFKKILEENLDKNIEVLLVNNGSTDNSSEVFENTLKSLSHLNIKVINVIKNEGYGNGILKGLEHATGDLLSFTHADQQTDPLDVLEALKIYNNLNPHPLLVKGYREKRKLSEAFFSSSMAMVSSAALGVSLTEVNAQPKMFSRDFYNSIKQKAPLDFSLDLYLYYCAKSQYKNGVVDFPVFFLPRLLGEAKGGSGSSFKTRLKLIKRTFKYIYELRKNLP